MLSKKRQNFYPQSRSPSIFGEVILGHLDMDDKQFHDWAVRKLAEDMKVEELEEFLTKCPSNELKHIFVVLNQKIIPALHLEGIPITKEECFKLFRLWFVRMTIATQNATPKDNTRQGNTTMILVASYAKIKVVSYRQIAGYVL
jgi:hypothetical protein